MENNKHGGHGGQQSSEYRGFFWSKRNKKWQANIYSEEGRQISGGVFLEEKDAARHVDKHEMDQQKFDKLNFYDSKQFLSLCDTSAAARDALAKHLAAPGSSGHGTRQYSSKLLGVTAYHKMQL